MGKWLLRERKEWENGSAEKNVKVVTERKKREQKWEHLGKGEDDY